MLLSLLKPSLKDLLSVWDLLHNSSGIMPSTASHVLHKTYKPCTHLPKPPPRGKAAKDCIQWILNKSKRREEENHSRNEVKLWLQCSLTWFISHASAFQCHEDPPDRHYFISPALSSLSFNCNSPTHTKPLLNMNIQVHALIQWRIKHLHSYWIHPCPLSDPRTIYHSTVFPAFLGLTVSLLNWREPAHWLPLSFGKALSYS